MATGPTYAPIAPTVQEYKNREYKNRAEPMQSSRRVSVAPAGPLPSSRRQETKFKWVVLSLRVFAVAFAGAGLAGFLGALPIAVGSQFIVTMSSLALSVVSVALSVFISHHGALRPVRPGAQEQRRQAADGIIGRGAPATRGQIQIQQEHLARMGRYREIKERMNSESIEEKMRLLGSFVAAELSGIARIKRFAAELDIRDIDFLFPSQEIFPRRAADSSPNALDIFNFHGFLNGEVANSFRNLAINLTADVLQHLLNKVWLVVVAEEIGSEPADRGNNHSPRGDGLMACARIMEIVRLLCTGASEADQLKIKTAAAHAFRLTCTDFNDIISMYTPEAASVSQQLRILFLDIFMNGIREHHAEYQSRLAEIVSHPNFARFTAGFSSPANPILAEFLAWANSPQQGNSNSLT